MPNQKTRNASPCSSLDKNNIFFWSSNCIKLRLTHWINLQVTKFSFQITICLHKISNEQQATCNTVPPLFMQLATIRSISPSLYSNSDILQYKNIIKQTQHQKHENCKYGHCCDYVLSSSMIHFNQHSVLFFIVYTLLLYVPTYKSIFKISYMIFELYMCIEKYNLRTRSNARAFVLVNNKHPN
jgi:hypothetical protein